MNPGFLLSAWLAASPSASRCAQPEWPLWQRYVEHFVSRDGRVIDRTDGGHSTSEGQAYGMVLALVANDRPTFERLYGWTRDNLVQGKWGKRLPAWKWGRNGQGLWKVVDENSASDADLWMAYALWEAGRLWKAPRYTALATSLLEGVVAQEVAELPGLGPTLLPGARGFVHQKGKAWRLNPSYLPVQVMRRFASAGVPGPWEALVHSSARIIADTAPLGFSPDWVLYHRERGFGVDPLHGGRGSYDAIRVVLWLGMLPEEEPLRARLVQAADGPYRFYLARGYVPERVEVRSLEGAGAMGPPGFLAALLPEAVSRKDLPTRQALEKALAQAHHQGLYGRPPRYYEQNLILFAQGFAEGRFRFAADGGLITSWERLCDGK